MSDWIDKRLRGYYYYDPDELGEDCFKLLGDDEIAEVKRHIHEAVRAGKIETLESLKYHKNKIYPAPHPISIHIDAQLKRLKEDKKGG